MPADKNPERKVYLERKLRQLLLLSQSTGQPLNNEDVSTLLGSVSEKADKRIFHDYDELKNAPPVRFIVQDFLQAEGVTMLAGLSGHGKTWIAAEMVAALLTEEPLFKEAQFKVIEPAKRVLYLTPENGAGPIFFRFCTKFKLDEHIKSRRLLIHTLSIGEKVRLTDPRLLAECLGADVFLDTMARFREGDENASGDNQALADALFNIVGSGARTVTVLQHSPKEFRKAREMFLENVVRGSGDIGAMISTCWGVRQVNADKNLVYVQNVKPRDFTPPEPFMLRLRPDIDESGRIGMEKAPGECGTLEEELAESESPKQDKKDKDKKDFALAEWSKDQKMGRPELNKRIRKQFGKGIKTETLAEWLVQFKSAGSDQTLFSEFPDTGGGKQ
jgi:hypothetical protein